MSSLANTTAGKERGLDAARHERPDEAYLAAAAAAEPSLDAATEKQLVRKMDRRVITLVFLAYLCAFLDRSNIGNAQTAGMGLDLGFDDAQYQVLFCYSLASTMTYVKLKGADYGTVAAHHLLHSIQ